MRVGAAVPRNHRCQLAPRQARAFFQPFADFLQARLAAREHACGMGLESRVVLIDLQSDQVNSLAAPAGRQLDSWDEANGGGLAGGARFGQSRRGVVVGEREGGDPAGARPLHQQCRCQHAIGKMAVRVEIDQ